VCATRLLSVRLYDAFIIISKTDSLFLCFCHLLSLVTYDVNWCTSFLSWFTLELHMRCFFTRLFVVFVHIIMTL